MNFVVIQRERESSFGRNTKRKILMREDEMRLVGNSLTSSHLVAILPQRCIFLDKIRLQNVNKSVICITSTPIAYSSISRSTKLLNIKTWKSVKNSYLSHKIKNKKSDWTTLPIFHSTHDDTFIIHVFIRFHFNFAALLFYFNIFPRIVLCFGPKNKFQKLYDQRSTTPCSLFENHFYDGKVH